MTLRRLLWILVPAAVAAALAVLALPPRAMPERVTLAGELLGLNAGQWRQDVEQAHRETVSHAREHLAQAIAARAHGASDLRAAASPRALRSRTEPLSVVRDPDVPDSAARAWLGAAERELSFVPRAGARGVPVVLALHTRNPAGLSGSVVNETLRDRFQFDEGGSRACVVDAVFPQQRFTRERDRFAMPRGGGSVLGRCALYARYGWPGRGAQRWAGVAASWSGRWSWYENESAFTPRRASVDTVPFRQMWGDVPWAYLGCLRGRDGFCQTLAGLPGGAWLPRTGWGLFYYYGWGYQPTVDRLVADLIVRRGTERFVRFWTSPLRADSALAAAYGVPAGAVVREAFARRLVPAPPAGPGTGRLLVAGGWVIALGLLAMALAWRREMDL